MVVLGHPIFLHEWTKKGTYFKSFEIFFISHRMLPLLGSVSVLVK